MSLARPDRRELIRWLRTTDPAALEPLFRAARAVTEREVGPRVYLRGLVEFSNECVKNCFYCGIRRGNLRPRRYAMTEEEILRCARAAAAARYGSLVLQAGERSDPGFVAFVETVVARIRRETGLGITLSLGEQSPATYARWFRAGAHRYLLRIETSNPRLYARLHPRSHSFQRRLACLRALRDAGYLVGTGVMIGLPGQTPEDLADDILCFERLDADMVGMGPYVPHAHTPLAAGVSAFDAARQLRLGLIMIALTRLRLRDVNIAAATALQALHPAGRELGVGAGANVLMPNLTPAPYRAEYRLYDGKPCLAEDAADCRACLEQRLRAIGVAIGYGELGDAPHFQRRIGTWKKPPKDSACTSASTAGATSASPRS